MSKPDWKDAPEWAQFLAQDKDGDWFWYDQEPYLRSGYSWSWPSVGRVERANIISHDWQETLERRP